MREVGSGGQKPFSGLSENHQIGEENPFDFKMQTCMVIGFADVLLFRTLNFEAKFYGDFGFLGLLIMSNVFFMVGVMAQKRVSRIQVLLILLASFLTRLNVLVEFSGYGRNSEKEIIYYENREKLYFGRADREC